MAKAAAGSYYETYWQSSGSGYKPVESTTIPHLLRDYGGPTSDCLDIGCGDGVAAGRYLSRHAASYVGVDISATAVAMAQANGLQAQVIQDAADLPFEDQSFDFIVCFEVFEHLFDTEGAAAEIKRVLRPGGHAVLQVPNVAHWGHRVDLGMRGRFVAGGDTETLTRPWRDPHIRFFTFDAMERLLASVGLQVVATSGRAGNQLDSVPFLRRFRRTGDSGPIGRALARLRPSLFANRIQMVARR